MKSDRQLAFHYGLTIFLSAFLLFQVQPMIGKMILPWFGGSASVWTTCMLFFQAILLVGYLYSHGVVRRLSPYRQSMLHIGLLFACLIFLPIRPSEGWKPSGAENPTVRILGLLTVSLGLPYFVLSTTGPLIQAWFARERSGVVPYRLFALSNFGSMLALLAYPVAIEPYLPTRWQSYLWSGLFICFILACARLAWRGRLSQPVPEPELEGAPPLRWSQTLLWAALAACPSILMVADTSHLTENIAPIPMLWVAPLTLYLLSFILCFERQGWYQRRIFVPPLILGLMALAYLPTLGMSALPIYAAIPINLVAFFAACMVCHGELALQKPHPARLTIFYLMLAVGGSLGGFFVGVVAPYWFDSHYELTVGILLTGIVAAVAILPRHAFTSTIHRKAAFLGAAAILLVIGWVSISDHYEESSGADIRLRNFYGTLRVFTNPEGGYRSLFHGQIIHGRQFLAPQDAHRPTTYYTTHGGAGKAIQAKAERGPLRVGVIGLGIGTLASYGQKGDYYRLYDIDPMIVQVARENFSFLSSTKARTEIILGDARLQLERETSQNFDVLVLDAFSGDSVPVHLLTREAFQHYFRHLKPDGVLAIHITNRFLDLRPVVKAAADHLGSEARQVDFAGDRANLIFRSRWVLLSRSASFFEHPMLKTAVSIPAFPSFRPWRDDYSSLLSILK